MVLQCYFCPEFNIRADGAHCAATDNNIRRRYVLMPCTPALSHALYLSQHAIRLDNKPWHGLVGCIWHCLCRPYACHFQCHSSWDSHADWCGPAANDLDRCKRSNHSSRTRQGTTVYHCLSLLLAQSDICLVSLSITVVGSV